MKATLRELQRDFSTMRAKTDAGESVEIEANGQPRYIFKLVDDVPRECKRRPNAKAMAWLESVDETECALSVLALGEIEKGIYALPAGSDRTRHEAGLKALRLRFVGRILDIDEGIAAKWGALLGESERKGSHCVRWII